MATGRLAGPKMAGISHIVLSILLPALEIRRAHIQFLGLMANARDDKIQEAHRPSRKRN